MRVDLSAGRDPAPTPGLSGYRLFRIFGFEVKLNATWLLLGLLITWTLAAGTFPATYPDLSQQIYWWMGVAGAVGILFSIVFHELSHALVARRFGLPIKGITLFIFGGVAEMEEEPVSPKVEFLMAVAGPVASLVLGFALFQLEAVAKALDWHTAVIGVSHVLATINIVVALFNLAPAFPLDGGRMLRAALWHWYSDLRRATRIASAVGGAFGLALMILGVLAFIQGSFIGGMWWFLIGAFVRGAASASYRQMLVREVLSDQPVRRFMQRNPISVPPETSLEHLLQDYVYPYHSELLPVVSNEKLLGCINARDIGKTPRDQWSRKTVGELVVPCSPSNTVAPDTAASQLTADMSKARGNTRYLVVENERLLGTISLQDLREYIALKLELEPGER